MAEKKRILIVEDEIDLVEMIQSRLEGQGYEVIVAYDGQDGLQKARCERPDLIILDIMLPKIEGYKICRMLKFDHNFMHIKVVILTARSQERDKSIGIDMGADIYLTKPFDADVLLEHINKLLKE